MINIFRKNKKEESLPKRFWNYGDLSEEDKIKNVENQLYHNLKGSEFKKYATKYLTPRLRDLGFKGGGFNFRRQEGHFIHTIQLFGDKYGGQGWVEIGIHLDFMPDLFFESIEPNKIKTIDCVYRHSLHLTNGNQMVDYGTNEEEARFSIDLMYNMILKQGISYFDLFKDFPRPFNRIELADLKMKNPEFDKYRLNLDNIITILNLARINVFLGNLEKARIFSEFGLQQLEQTPSSNEWDSLFKRLMNGDTNFGFTED
ncbi:MAG: DUF4304 domain-containing protein [Cyclobacteriaceae bacterium]|nr:DUF4304 domain-containing protein [Cyclobacteriaceae bacterium]